MPLAPWYRRHWSLLVYALLLVLAAALRFAALTQVPHTLWVDEAWFGQQGQVVLSGVNLLPLQPPGIGIGDSAFQIYAAALVQALGVPVTYSSRTASAFTGLLVVAASYPVLLTLVRSLLTERAAHWAALIGTGLVAVNFTALLHSRGGLQMSGAALATVLTAGGLYLTFRHASWRWAALTGLAVSLGQTTYEAALGLPLLVVVYTVLRLVWPAGYSRWRLARLAALLLAVALVAFSPLLVFYYFHPGIYLAHVGQTQAVADAAGPLGSLGRALGGLGQVLAGISLRGDQLPGRNVVGRPLFDPLASALLWFGIAWAFTRAGRQPAVQLLLVWAAVMALPSALSDDTPAFSRLLPMVPALAGLAGLGAIFLVRWVTAHWPKLRRAAVGLTAAALWTSAALGGYAYFVQWPAQAGFFDALHAGARLTAELAVTFTPTATVFVLPTTPPLVARPFELLLNSTPVQRLDATDCFPFADRAARDAVYGVIQVMDPDSLPRVQTAYPTGSVVGTVPHPDGYAYAVFFRVPAGTPGPLPQHPVSVEFANGLRLVGYSLTVAAAAGETVTLQLFWQTAASVSVPVSAFVHVGRGPNSDPLVAQSDGPLCANFEPDHWSPGYSYLETRSLTLAADAPADSYDVRVGAYDPTTPARIAIVSADVPTENDRAVLGGLAVR